MQIAVIIAASGSGLRLGGDMPKQFQPIGGKPILAHTMDAFNRAGIVSKIIVTAPAEYVARAWEIARDNGLHKVRAIITGGDNRAASIYAALKALPFVGTGPENLPKPHSPTEIVLIHDGVRPFVSEDLIQAVAKAASTHDAAITGTPLTDTIKEVDKNAKITATPDRSRFWQVQTPQGFTYELIMKAYVRGEKDGILSQATDDSMLVERLGITVHMVAGDPGNIKITTQVDLAMGEILLRDTERLGVK